MLQQIDKTRNARKLEQINSLGIRKKLAKAEFERVTAQYEHVKIEVYKSNCELQRLHDEFNLNVEMYGALIEQKEIEKTQLQAKFEELRAKSVHARIEFKELMSSLKKEKQTLKKSKSGLGEVEGKQKST